jgi:hypothetical protein
MSDDEVILERVEPGSLELKRYRVLKGGVEAGYVVQWETQIVTKIKGTRLIKNGKRRPLWTYTQDNGQLNYRVKLETRKDALKWLLG